jgi:hypothetical protein
MAPQAPLPLLLLFAAAASLPCTRAVQPSICERALAAAGPDARLRAEDLHEAARSNDVTSACMLLSAGADVNVRGM